MFMEILKPLNDSTRPLLLFANLYHLFRVATKRRRIIKEAIYSLGVLYAGILLGNNTTISYSFTSNPNSTSKKTILDHPHPL